MLEPWFGTFERTGPVQVRAVPIQRVVFLFLCVRHLPLVCPGPGCLFLRTAMLYLLVLGSRFFL